MCHTITVQIKKSEIFDKLLFMVALICIYSLIYDFIYLNSIPK